MNLANLANQTLKAFEAGKSKINDGGGNSGLSVGDHEAIIESVQHKVYDSGYDCVSIVFQAVDGEEAGQKEFVNISFAEKTKNGKDIPEFVLVRNIKLISALAQFSGFELDGSVFAADNETDIHEAIGNSFINRVGNPVLLTIEERPNKKNPDNPYRNYELSAPTSSTENIDVSDDEMPF